MLTEARGVGRALEVDARHLLHHDRPPARNPHLANVRAHVRQYVFYPAGQFAVAQRDVFIRQRTSVEVVLLHAIGETQSKLRVGGKRLKDSGDVGAAGEGATGEVVGGYHAPMPAQHLFAVGTEGALGVPQVKPPLGSGTAFAAGTPVVVRPVVHIDVDAQHDVVDEVIEVDQRCRLVVVRLEGEVGTNGEALEPPPLKVVSLADFSELRDEIPLGTTAVT